VHRLADNTADHDGRRNRDIGARHTILLESAHYHGERLDAAEQFPAMIAAALRKIVS
jgi:hypothetical protein